MGMFSVRLICVIFLVRCRMLGCGSDGFMWICCGSMVCGCSFSKVWVGVWVMGCVGVLLCGVGVVLMVCLIKGVLVGGGDLVGVGVGGRMIFCVSGLFVLSSSDIFNRIGWVCVVIVVF